MYYVTEISMEPPAVLLIQTESANTTDSCMVK